MCAQTQWHKAQPPSVYGYTAVGNARVPEPTGSLHGRVFSVPFFRTFPKLPKLSAFRNQLPNGRQANALNLTGAVSQTEGGDLRMAKKKKGGAKKRPPKTLKGSY